MLIHFDSDPEMVAVPVASFVRPMKPVAFETNPLSVTRSMPLPPTTPPFSTSLNLVSFVASRVLELTYTAWDLEAFVLDCACAGTPFRRDEQRRFLLRCELDAAYFHLYLGSSAEWGTDSPQLCEMFPTPRDAVDYIMKTFPIVKLKDITRTEI